TIHSWDQWLRWPYLFVSLVFVYTTVENIRERPEGIKIATFFIGAMVVTSVLSRALRSTELRIRGVELDPQASALLSEDEDRVIRLIARRPQEDTSAILDELDRVVRECHN